MSPALEMGLGGSPLASVLAALAIMARGQGEEVLEQTFRFITC